MIIDKIIQIVGTCMILILLASCTSYKNIPYLQGNEGVTEIDLQTVSKSATTRFQPDDILSITVNASREPAAAAAFNLPLQPSTSNEDLEDERLNVGYGRQTYMVNKDGQIDFPILGAIKVIGMTKDELEETLKVALRKYMKEDPVITVRLTNHHVSVLGEVARPGQYSITKDKVNLFEALSLAGDMTIYGKRQDVALMRELPDGSMKIVRLDLTNASVVSSPYFYLQQNDIVYVEPNKAKANSSSVSAQTGTMISLGSMLIGIANLIFLITK